MRCKALFDYIGLSKWDRLRSLLKTYKYEILLLRLQMSHNFNKICYDFHSVPKVKVIYCYTWRRKKVVVFYFREIENQP